MKQVLAVVAVVLALVVGGLVFFAGQSAKRIAALEARVSSENAGGVRNDLPARIEAFARRGMAGARPVGAVRLTQAAEMRLKRGASWSPMPARQVISTAETGFVWVAEMGFGPVMAVRVVDRFVGGEGGLDVRFFGAFPLGREEGSDMARAEAMRYLAELVWAPDAILTNRAIIWEEAEEGVRARLDTSGGPAEVVFSFDEAGDIVAVSAEERPAKLADGTFARLPWRGWLRDYAEIGGRRIPLQAEVGYEYPDGFESYWRGRVTGYEVVSGAGS